MTNSAVTGGIVIANALAVVSIATATELNPILECIQNGASVGAIMGIPGSNGSPTDASSSWQGVFVFAFSIGDADTPGN